LDTNLWVVLIAFGVPFVSMVIMFCCLVVMNKATTGEIKHILPPEVFLKLMAILMVVIVTFLLAYTKLLDQTAVAAILGSIGTAVGMNLRVPPQ